MLPATIRALEGLKALAVNAIQENPDIPQHEIEPDAIDQASAAVLIGQATQTAAIAGLYPAYSWSTIAYFSWWVSTAFHFLDIYDQAPPAAAFANIEFLMNELPDRT